jgi:hypothetical protein
MFKLFEPIQLLKPVPTIIAWLFFVGLIVENYPEYVELSLTPLVFLFGIWFGGAWEKSHQNFKKIIELKILINERKVINNYIFLRKYLVVKKITELFGVAITGYFFLSYFSYVLVPLFSFIGNFFLGLNEIFNNWYVKIPGAFFIIMALFVFTLFLCFVLLAMAKKIFSKIVWKNEKIKEKLTLLKHLESELNELR